MDLPPASNPLLLSDRLLQEADFSLIEASPFDFASSRSMSQTIDMVRTALAQGRMRLAFQPAVYAADPGIIAFYEGYIRLLDDRGVTIPASDFMALAETRELGREIDVAALRLGLQTLAENPQLRIAVNMSARSIGYKRWRDTLSQALTARPELGKGLIFEIREASAMQMPDVLLPFMAELRRWQITFTLDDFCDSFTSLSLLEEFGFDIAKLDGRFIRNCHQPGPGQMILQGAIALAEAFDMILVAEAVETAEEAQWLTDQGVSCLQGYYFARPELKPDFSLFTRSRQI